jgi:hypothetical protein
MGDTYFALTEWIEEGLDFEEKTQAKEEDLTNPVPLMKICDPPDSGPLAGKIEVTIGWG